MITHIGDVKELSGQIYLVGRQEGTKVILRRNRLCYPHSSFFYLNIDYQDLLDDIDDLGIEIEQTNKRSLYGDRVVKVYYNRRSKYDWVRMKEFFETNKKVVFESDIYDRVLYCLDELPNSKEYDLEYEWKKGYIDIETQVHGGISDANNPTDEILCLTIFDSYTGLYNYFYYGKENIECYDIVRKYEKEEEMLRDVLAYISTNDFDIIMGWNVNFDISYLLKRYEFLTGDRDLINKLSPIKYVSYNEDRKQYSIFGIVIFDLLGGYMRVHRLGVSGYSLDNVSFEELGERKIEVNFKTLGTISKQKLYEYNRKDVELCVKLDEKLHIFEFYDSLRKFIGGPFDVTDYASSMIDFLLLKKGRELGIVLPPRPEDTNEKRLVFQGAFVDAIPGKYSNVINFDIKGMYPNIIKTFNLSKECIKDDGEIKIGTINISNKQKGIIPMIIDDLLQLRKRYDKERDKHSFGEEGYVKFDMLIESVKCVIDAVYGVNAYPRFRLFKAQIAEAITFLGREIIHHTRERLEKMGYKVVITDTDSCDFIIPGNLSKEEIVKEGYRILGEINGEYEKWMMEKFNIVEKGCFIVNDFKKVYLRMIVGAKKRYVAKVIWSKGKDSNGVEIVGFHNKRSDSSRFARNLQLELIVKLLNDETELQILNFLDSKIKEMKKLQPIELAIPTKIEKELDDYNTNLPKKRGAKYSSHILGITFYMGDKPLLLFTKGESDVILFFKNYEAEKLLEKVSIDWDKMIERNIFLVSDMLLENCGMLKVMDSLKLQSQGQTSLKQWGVTLDNVS